MTLPYRVVKGRVTVRALSSPDATTWSKVTGTIHVDLDRPDGARAEISVDMRSFEAGDWFQNWQRKGNLDADAHPTAKLLLMRLESLREASPGQLEGTAVGQLQWRGRTAEIRVRGKARVNPRAIEASGSFDLDPASFGIRTDERLRAEVSVSATAT